MKRDRLATLLMFCLVCCTLGAAAMGYEYLRASRQLRSLQMEAARIGQNQVVMQALALDLNDYARRNPDIEPLLEKLNMRPRALTNSSGSRP